MGVAIGRAQGRVWITGVAVGLFLAAAAPVGAAARAVAVSRLEVPRSIDDPEGVREAFEPLVLGALEDAGFTVIPPAEADPVWNRHREACGPFYDPVTGEPHAERLRAARRATLGELATARGAVGWIRPAIEHRSAPYERGKASWDGATEGARPTGAGEVIGLSLALALVSPSGDTVVTGRGGIQLLTKYSKWSSKFMVVRREDLFRDGKRNRAAVERALEPLPGALAQLPAPAAFEPESLPPIVPPETAPSVWPSLSAGTRAAVLRPIRAATGGVEVPAEVRERYRDLVRARLRAAGWTVVEPDPYESAYAAAAARIGGLYDPWTGAAVPGRVDSARALARRELAAHAPGAVVVLPVVTTVLAPFRNQKATWHGVTESVAEISRISRLLATTSGQTEALSFLLFAEDTDGREVHRGAGGIQLAARLEKKRFVPVPPESLFTRPSRDERAVELAFRGFPTPSDPRLQPDAPGP